MLIVIVLLNVTVELCRKGRNKGAGILSGKTHPIVMFLTLRYA